MARATTKEALALLNSLGASAHASRLKELIGSLDKGLQISITDKEISDHINNKIRASTAKKTANATFTDRRRLTKARVITTEEVIRLREAREKADGDKAAKTSIREEKKKLKELLSKEELPSSKYKAKSKKSVSISTTISVNNLKDIGRVGVDDDEDEWYRVEDFEEESKGSPPPPPRRTANMTLRGGKKY
ncbi:uncharacterized protein H6S33_006924 [Morchella sextelata]|uniref:uncharacterized protein n=1 Tax=Morchella sextelata TaxID=1174677 RepID=UPI001D03FA08|nr:uncharacterized protein H6S33_006924 [Morchella sextelata]KAH0604547.1 hypothetical protein H6S33_006924 [Morchella sextelata]